MRESEAIYIFLKSDRSFLLSGDVVQVPHLVLRKILSGQILTNK